MPTKPILLCSEMIQGIGNDIIEVERIKRSIERYGVRFLQRIYTPKEQEYCNRYGLSSPCHYAGRFAAKEAVVKALGTGFRHGICWTDIEILNDTQGKPCVLFSTKFKEIFGEPHVLLSISHCHAYATAVVVVEGE